MYSVAWSPTAADVVATGGADDTAYIWRVGQEAFEQTGGAVLELSGHSDTVSALAFSADGSTLASGGMDGQVKVWEAASGRCLQTLEGPGDAVEWVAWHPKGNVLLAGAADFTAWMWLPHTGACMQVRCVPGEMQRREWAGQGHGAGRRARQRQQRRAAAGAAVAAGTAAPSCRLPCRRQPRLTVTNPTPSHPAPRVRRCSRGTAALSPAAASPLTARRW